MVPIEVACVQMRSKQSTLMPPPTMKTMKEFEAVTAVGTEADTGADTGADSTAGMGVDTGS